jgi:hypothetical protein
MVQDAMLATEEGPCVVTFARRGGVSMAPPEFARPQPRAWGLEFWRNGVQVGYARFIGSYEPGRVQDIPVHKLREAYIGRVRPKERLG